MDRALRSFFRVAQFNGRLRCVPAVVVVRPNESFSHFKDLAHNRVHHCLVPIARQAERATWALIGRTDPSMNATFNGPV